MVHTSCRSIRNIAVVHGTCIMSLVHSIGCRSGKNNGQFQHGVARQLALLAYPKFPSNLFMTRTLLLLYADAVHGGMEIRLPIPIFSCEAVSRGYCIILGIGIGIECDASPRQILKRVAGATCMGCADFMVDEFGVVIVAKWEWEWWEWEMQHAAFRRS